MSGLSFSAAYRWMNCIGSKQMCRQTSRTPQSPEALEGVQAHAVACAVLEGKGEPINWGKVPVEQRDEMFHFGQEYAKVVNDIAKAYGCTGERHLEKRWTHPKNPIVRGDADVIIDGGPEPVKTLLVGDYKYGKGVPISAERNYQLMITAITRLRNLGRDASKYRGAVLFIHQPRSIFGDTFSSWFAPFSELAKFEQAALDAAQNSDSPDAKLTPGDWCKMCNAKVICPAFVEENFTPIAEMPALTGYTLQQLGPLLAKAKLVKQWVDDLDQYVRHALSGGYNVPGWKLQTRNGTRVWQDQAVADEALRSLIGEKRYKQTLLSPTQVLQKYSELEETLSPLIQQPKINVLLKER